MLHSGRISASLMMRIAILALCVFAVLAAPTKPAPPNSFVSTGSVLHVEEARRLQGTFTLAKDFAGGRASEKTVMEPADESFTVVERYDQKKLYEIFGATQQCRTFPLDGQITSTWSWLSNATFTGRRTHEGRVLEFWEARIGFARRELGVDAKEPNRPVVLMSDGAQRQTTQTFLTFTAGVPPTHYFDTPSTCPATFSKTLVGATALDSGCVARATMMSTAQAWVNARVPYNQAGRHDGYRTDCSGYVSAIWELGKPGLVTSTLPSVSHRITKAELKEGDVLLNTAEHVIIFGGWVGTGQTHYMGYEETRPGEGTVKRETPYPYWYSQNLFVPYRLNSAC